MYGKREKKLLVEQLRKTPVVQVACQKLGISRAAYYRWRQDDRAFAESADRALVEGSQLVNDMAESQLIQAIQARDLSAIRFWLQHHHRAYGMKLELSGTLGVDGGALTEEQERLVRRALRLASDECSDDQDPGQPNA